MTEEEQDREGLTSVQYDPLSELPEWERWANQDDPADDVHIRVVMAHLFQRQKELEEAARRVVQVYDTEVHIGQASILEDSILDLRNLLSTHSKGAE